MRESHIVVLFILCSHLGNTDHEYETVNDNDRLQEASASRIQNHYTTEPILLGDLNE